MRPGPTLQSRIFKFQSGSKIPQILNLSPGPSPGPHPKFAGPGLRDPGDPVADADPCFPTVNLVHCVSKPARF